MKKLFVLLVALILAAGVAFAQENGYDSDFEVATERPIEIFNLEISIGFPVHWTNGLHNDEFYRIINEPSAQNMMEDKSVTANTAIGLATIFNFTRTFGWKLDLDFFYGAKLQGFSQPTSDFIGLSGANIFFGPVFYIFNNNVLRLPLAVGFHMYYFTEDLWVPQLNNAATPNGGLWMNRSDVQFGPAVSLGVQFHFNRDLYMFSKTGVAIDLFRVHRIKWYDGDDFWDEDHRHFNDISVNWSIKPSLGLGIKY